MTIAYTDEQLAEFFSYYSLLVDNGVIPTIRTVNGYGAGIESMRPWITGQWGGTMAPNGQFMAAYLDEGQSLTIPPHLMRGDADEAGLHYRPGSVYTISRHSRHPEAAAKFLDFLMHDEESILIMKDNRGIPYNSASNEILQKSGILDTESLRFSSYNMMNSLTYKTEINAVIEDAQIADLVSDIYQKIDYTGLSPEGAAQEFRRRADRILRRLARS